MLTSAALGVLAVGLVVAQASLLASAITAVYLDGAGLADLRGDLVALAATVAGRAVLAWAQEAASHRAAVAVKTELRGRLLAHVARLGPAWLQGPAGRAAEVTTLTTRGLDALDPYFSRYLPQLALAALVPVAILVRVMPADLVAGLTILVTLPLIPVFMALVGLTTEQRSRLQFALLTRLSRQMLEMIAGLSTLKAFGRASAQARAIRRLSEDQRRLTMRTLRLAFLSSLVLELLATLSVALVAVGVGLRLVGGSMDLRTALLVLILAPEAYLPLRQLGTHYHASAEGLAAAAKVFAILETPAPPRGTRTDLPGAPIVFDNLTVRYPDRAEPALTGLTLRIEPGELVALTGPSGGGKSTALAALLGFVRPASGRILVGDGPAAVDLADADPDAWRARVAYVPQRPYLFAGTVADNIRLGRPEASDAIVGRAARLADLVLDLSTPVGENGATLSAGQRQRLALARAFLRDAPVVVLDEPTASLDGSTEATIVAAIRRLAEGRTVLMAAHRPALLAVADRVVSVTSVPAPVGALA
jgi:thiol reductant ABC exporter CydD subunit